MGRLIDADALIEEIKSLQVSVTGLRAGKGILNEYAKMYRESLLRIVDEQPTAYDVEKVVAQINKRIKFLDGVINLDINSKKYTSANKNMDKLNEVIAIKKLVKRGGEIDEV